MQKETAGRRLPIGIATAVGLGLAAPVAQADDYTVDNTADAGPGSLRNAIGATNTNPGADRILFKSGLSGEITLGSDLTPISGALEVVGPGQTELAIDGNEEHQIFTTTGDLAVSDLTLRNARAFKLCNETGDSCQVSSGGAILGKEGANIDVDRAVFRGNESEYLGGGAISVKGDLSVDDSTFEGNSSNGNGGAIDSSTHFPEEPGDLTIRNSNFTDNRTTGDPQDVGGGAVSKNSWFTVTSVVISGSTFSGNSTAGQGGALQVNNYGPVNVTDSTFTENSGNVGGGAFISFWQGPGKISGSYFGGNQASHPWKPNASGGGLVIGAALGGFTVENSTFFGNKTSGKGGAILSGDSPIILDSVTVVGNEGDGALYKGPGQSTLRNSIVSGNTGVDVSGDKEFKPDYPWGGPAIPFWKDAGTWKTSNSLIGTTNETALVEDDPSSNIVGNPYPGVDAPADNGGPTLTMLPAESSPAVDAGSTDLSVDQRGLSRPIGAADDIGAVESRPEDYLEPIAVQSRVRFGKVRLNKRKGVATLPVKVPAAGAVTLIGSKKLVGRKARTKAAGTVKLKVKSRGKALKALKKRGKVLVRVGVKFAAATGEKIPAGTSVKLVKMKPNKKKKR